MVKNIFLKTVMVLETFLLVVIASSSFVSIPDALFLMVD